MGRWTDMISRRAPPRLLRAPLSITNGLPLAFSTEWPSRHLRKLGFSNWWARVQISPALSSNSCEPNDRSIRTQFNPRLYLTREYEFHIEKKKGGHLSSLIQRSEMEGMLLKTSVNSLICHPQAGQQQTKSCDFNSQLAPCSSFTPNTISHSLTSRPASSAISSKSKSSQMKRAAGVGRAAVQTGETVDMTAFDDITIYTTDGDSVKFSELWNRKNGKAVVAFLRHFGCPFCWEFAAALREAKPKFDAAGFKLITIGVGPSSKAQVLAEKLPFPAECLYADPDRKAYDALGLYHGVARTWLNPASMQIFTRLDKVAEAVKGYNLDVMPDNTSATLQQGGVYVFEGSKVLYARKDESTGDHSKIDDILSSCCSTVMA